MRLSVLTALAVGVSAVKKHYMYGYFPDDYYAICEGYAKLNAAYINDCANYTTTENYGACNCVVEDVVRTLYQCLADYSKLSSDPHAMKHSWVKYNRWCTYFESNLIWTQAEASAAVAANPIQQTWEQANATGTGAFRLPHDFFSDEIVSAGSDYYWQLSRGPIFGQAMVIYVFGIFGIQIILNIIAWLLPSLLRVVSNYGLGRIWRKYFALPALWNHRSSEPATYWGGFISVTIPPRIHSFLIFGYVGLTTLFMAYNYPAYLCEMLQASWEEYVSLWVGYRTGILAMYCMPLLWLFAGRNNFLIWLTGWQYEIFSHWHRWIARVFLILIVLHAIFWSWDFWLYSHSMVYLRDNYVLWGWSAGACMILMIVLSLKQFRRWSYELFVVFHVLLGVFVAVGTYFHIRALNMCREEFWTTIAIWAFDRVVRLVRIMLANPFTSRATLTALEGCALEIRVKYSGFWKPRPGSYVFIYFLDPIRCFQSHPFSVIPLAGEKDSLKLVAHVRNGLTKSLHERALASGGTLDYRVLIEGPYGVEFNGAAYQENVFVAGGVGFAAVYSHIIGLVKVTSSPRNIYLHWIVRHHNALSWFSEELIALRESNIIVSLYITHTDNDEEDIAAVAGTPSIKSVKSTSVSDNLHFEKFDYRPNVRDIVRTHIKESQGPICFFVCGPHSMNDDVRYGCANGIDLTPNHVQFYEESFTM